ncbi:IclR family transcriptional regulator [Streptomyces sp. NBC_01231]|nr:IclR family transcriptional regulator [Streptomyces sp. NBC_01231]
MSNSGKARNGSVHSVNRAISILQVLALRGAAGVTQIAGELDVHKSTVFRLLATLEARGLVEQDASRGQYRLGHGVVQLAAGATRKYDISVISRPICQELAETIGESVNIAIRDGHDLVTIDQVMGNASVTTVDWVGQRNPLHTTAPGKLFLATMPEADRRSILDQGLERHTDYTIVDAKELEKQLAQVRVLGYAYTEQEHEIGLTAVSAPIRAANGGMIAAMVVSGPSFRITSETIPEVAEKVVSAAAAISERNGFPKSGRVM